MTLFQFLLASLATFRLAYLITSEAGPFHIARRFRSMVVRKAPKKTHLDEGIRCPYCSGLQAAILIAAYTLYRQVLWGWIQQTGEFVILFLAVGGAALIWHQLFMALRKLA